MSLSYEKVLAYGTTHFLPQRAMAHPTFYGLPAPLSAIYTHLRPVRWAEADQDHVCKAHVPRQQQRCAARRRRAFQAAPTRRRQPAGGLASIWSRRCCWRGARPLAACIAAALTGRIDVFKCSSACMTTGWPRGQVAPCRHSWQRWAASEHVSRTR